MPEPPMPEPSMPTPAEPTGLIGETYVGCFLDKGNRDLMTKISQATRDPRKCFEMASQKGFLYAGLQAGRECWAGYMYGKHGERPQAECDRRCG